MLSKLPIKLPEQDKAFMFIRGTHEVDGIDLSPAEINATYKGKIQNPYADGHLQAINYIFNLLDKEQFPAHSYSMLTNRFKSNMALHWLRDLHSLITTPILNSPINTDPANLQPILRSQIGTYRVTDAMNAFSLCPPPNLIPKILHNWLLDITRLNEETMEKISKPFGISRKDAMNLEKTSHETLMMFVTVQPFSVANNRLGRLVENALRLQWRLPWKVTAKNEEYEQYTMNLATFQKETLPILVRKAKELPML